MLEYVMNLFTHEMLVNIWFLLWSVIWVVYLIADSFPLGVGLLSPIAKNSAQTEQIVKTVSPFWGGNQVWLILAAGGTFAAFPLIFSKMFTWLYLPMMLLLIGIILRGLFIELIHYEKDEKLRNIFRWLWFLGSLIITIVLGVFFTNLFIGLPITVSETEYIYSGNLLGLFSPIAILGAILFILLFTTSGSLWISHKTVGEVKEKTQSLSGKLSIATAVVALIYIIGLFNKDGFATNYNDCVYLYIIPSIAVVFALLTIALTLIPKTKSKPIAAFFTNLGTIIFGATVGIISLYPNILKSNIELGTGVDIFTGASSHMTLTLMLVAALVFVPIVLIYQTWTYTQFMEKIEEK